MGDKNYKEKHIKMGLCRDCSNRAYGSYCPKCLERRRVQDKKRRGKKTKDRKDNFRCTCCGTPLSDIDIEGKYFTCSNCRGNLHIVFNFIKRK